MKKNSKRILSLLLVLMMVVSLFPTAYAAETGEVIEDEGYGSSWEDWDVQPAEEGAPIEEEPTDPFVEEPVEQPTPAEEPVEEPAPVEEPVEEPAPVEEPVVEEEPEVSYPANTFYYVGGSGLRVTVDAPEGAFPADAEMTVTEIDPADVQGLIDASAFNGQVAFVAADISFADAEGNELQPEVPVVVTMRDDNYTNVDDPMILHIADNGEVSEVPPFLNDLNRVQDFYQNGVLTVQSADYDPFVPADAAPLSLSFEASSFSTFTVTWGTNYRVTIHHGYMEGGAFVEFPAGSSTNANYPTSLSWSNYGNDAYAVLIYDFKDYQYVETRYSTTETSAPTSGTAIWPALQKRNASGSNNDNWRYCNASSTSWNRDGACANNSHIYVIYQAKTITTGASGGSGSGQPGPDPTPPPFTPDVGKLVTNQKPDGTYDVTLGFVGDKETNENVTKARVIVVLDLSGSMNYNMAGGSSTSATNPSRITLAQTAVNKLAETLLAIEDSQHNKLVEMGLVTFATDARIRTFGTNASTFTSDYSTYSTLISGLPISGNDNLGPGVNAIGRGTNWEKALDLANSVPTSAAGKTYIVFVSDGDPTFRVSRSKNNTADTNDTDLVNEMTFDRVTIPIFGTGNNTDADNIPRCFNSAREIAKSIVEHTKTFYAVGLSSDATRMTNLASYSGGTYKAGNDADEFAASLADIAGAISSEVGLSNVVINDGVTSMSQIETQALIGTAGNFTYNKSYPLTAGDSGYTYKIGETTYNITQAQVDAGTDGTHRIYTRRNSAGVDVIYVEYPWDGAPEAKIQSDNSVKWDTSAANSTLEHGVYYSVTFTVWPKQEAYDLIADLNNKIQKISAQTAGVKQQLRVLVDGTTYEYDIDSNTWLPGGLTDAQLENVIASASTVVYSMKTNTGLSASYEFGGVPGSAEYTNYINGNMTLVTSTFDLMKDWENLLPEDSRTAQWLKAEEGYEPPEGSGYTVDEDGYLYLNGKHVLYIDLIVTKDGGEYTQVRLRSDTDPAWRYNDMFISLGVLSVNSGKITVRETGHNYTVDELPSDAYYWELTAYIYRPMVVNGATIMLQKLEEGDEGYETAMALDAETTDGTYYKLSDQTVNGVTIAGGVYLAIANQDAVLKAVNHRRSYLNLTKEVKEEDAPADALFTYTVTITDPNGEDIWFSAYDPEIENPDGTKGGTVMDLDVTGATAEEGNTGYWYAASGTEFTIKIKAGWNVRFINLVSETSYEITEVESAFDPGFVFDEVTATAEVQGVVQEDYEPEIDGSAISGEIEAPNTDYTVTYTNKYLGAFYVYHSSDNTVERIFFTDDRVTMSKTDGAYSFTFDIANETKDSFLYGGYYTNYAGKSTGYDSTKVEAWTDGWYDDSKDADGKDTDAIPYDGDTAAWVLDEAYVESETNGHGLAMHPVQDTTYYLKEVPAARFLQPYTHYTYYLTSYNIANMWAISDIDDLNYLETGFVITNNEVAKVCKSLTVQNTSGGAKVTLKPTSVFRAQGATANDYLTYKEVTGIVANGSVLLQYWVTPDGLMVTGITQRTLDKIEKKTTIEKNDVTVASTIAVFEP